MLVSSGDVVHNVDAIHLCHILLLSARSQLAMDDMTNIFLPNFPPTPFDPQPPSQVQPPQVPI